MYVKEMEYIDFNGVARKEKFYFNLTQAEILDMELGKVGGFTEYIKKIIEAQNTPELMALFKNLLLKSYGVKSDDGRKFIKNDAVREDFEQTQAFSDLYMLLALNDEEASKFINGIVPAEMRATDAQREQLTRELLPQAAQPAE